MKEWMKGGNINYVYESVNVLTFGLTFAINIHMCGLPGLNQSLMGNIKIYDHSRKIS